MRKRIKHFLHLDKNRAPGSTRASTSPANANPSSSAPSNAKQTAWAGFKTFLKLLNASADAFGPLKSAVGGISQCIEIFEVYSISYLGTSSTHRPFARRRRPKVATTSERYELNSIRYSRNSLDSGMNLRHQQ
jgi:hypothetical protein